MELLLFRGQNHFECLAAEAGADRQVQHKRTRNRRQTRTRA